MASTKDKIPASQKNTTRRLGFFIKQYAIWLFIPIPAIIGMIGFYIEGGRFWNSAYSCLTMYLVDYGDPTDNTWIQLARWLAPIATAGSLSLVFTSIGKFVKRVYARCSKKSVAVFGNEDERAELLRELGANGIPMEGAAVRAGCYILVGSEEENLEFYEQNTVALQGKDVYLKCRSLPEQMSCDPHLHLFSPEETAARIFWKENCPYKISLSTNHRFKIAIFGFGGLCEELIVQGIQYNIFSPDQIIEYHIFGEDNGFTDTHPQLSEITDPIIFHSNPWYKSKDLIHECQMLIVVQQEEQLDLLQRLAKLFPQTVIHVFSAQASGIAMLEKNTGIVGFDWEAKSMLLESIRGANMHYLAKKLNLRYAHLYSGVSEDKKNMDSEWSKLDTFTRYSNISSANYHDVCMRILDGKELTEERLAFFGELEHIRWCRYHYLSNWKYGIPQSGKAKDHKNRIHSLLVPYDQLSEEEKEKDRENIRMLMALENEMGSVPNSV